MSKHGLTAAAERCEVQPERVSRSLAAERPRGDEHKTRTAKGKPVSRWSSTHLLKLQTKVPLMNAASYHSWLLKVIHALCVCFMPVFISVPADLICIYFGSSLSQFEEPSQTSCR